MCLCARASWELGGMVVVCLTITCSPPLLPFPRLPLVFNHTMEFAIEGADAPNTLLLSVWDWDRVGSDDFMGQVCVCLKGGGVEEGGSIWSQLWLGRAHGVFEGGLK